MRCFTAPTCGAPVEREAAETCQAAAGRLADNALTRVFGLFGWLVELTGFEPVTPSLRTRCFVRSTVPTKGS